MIKIPYEQIIEKIKQDANLSEEEIKDKIDAKMKQLSGLISKEGAAHIVANELGIKLFEAFSGKLQIKNILPGLRNVDTIGMVTQVYELREFTTNGRHGKVASLVIGDETGTIRAVLWGDQADNIKNISRGAILKIVGGYVRENNGNIELHVNERSKLIINPEGETVKEVKAPEQEATVRKPIDKLAESDTNVEILATIVQVFDPRFFPIDPETGRKVTESEGSYYLNEKQIENPDFSYVINIIVDDGTDNIRAVFFRDSMGKLISSSKEQILGYKENPQSFEEIKSNLLGTLVKINGRVKRNLFFDRLEIIANGVSINPDPDEEIKRLEEEANKAQNN
ncbi:MAG: OB-fold nucleic acid binding domain-containing protein [Nanoarchaeota archaeon]